MLLVLLLKPFTQKAKLVSLHDSELLICSQADIMTFAIGKALAYTASIILQIDVIRCKSMLLVLLLKPFTQETIKCP